MTTTDWQAKLKKLARERRAYRKWEQNRRQIIADAHDKGGLSHAQIAEILEVKRGQVIRIVNAVRNERR